MNKKIFVVFSALLIAALMIGFTSVMADDVVELGFWHSMDGVPGEITQKQVDLFNETVGAEKGIHVTTTFQDWPGTDALVAAKTTDDVQNMPDIMQLYASGVSIVKDWERTVWIEDMLETEGTQISKADLIPNAVASYSMNDRMMGMPWSISTLMLYYNADLLREAGYENPPATIAEMAEMCAAIVEKTDADYGLNVRVDEYEFETMITNQGPEGTYFGNANGGHNGYMTELGCEDQINAFLTEWEKVVASGGYKATRDSINEEFAQGLNAMVLMSSARIFTIKNLVEDSFEWGVAPVPTVSEEDAGGSAPSGSGLFLINRGDDEKIKAAWEFIQFMVSTDAQALWLDGYSYAPVNMNETESEAYQAAIAAEPKLAVSYEILTSTPASVLASFCPASDTVNSIIKDAMISFGQGAISKDDAFTAIVDGINGAFADYYRANPID